MKYFKLKQKIDDITCEKFLLGKSLLGENVVGFHVGNYAGKQILLTGGIHAREYISSLFLIEEIKYLKQLQFHGGFYIVPVLNPDGVRLVLDGARFIKDEKLKKFLCLINGGKNFALWKANANGVDLNVNFDAKWGEGKHNVRSLNKENFIGYYPNSEIENLNVINFMKLHQIHAGLAFHSKGEVIYYGFNMCGGQLKTCKKIAKELSKINSYKIIKSKNSVGGLSDFMIDKLNMPAFTIELGSDYLEHPIKEKHLKTIFEQNKNVPLKMLEIINKM